MKVSVIIPTRNRLKHLRECIDSLLQSDFDDVEIIVVDDASDFNIAKEIENQYKTCKVLRNNTRKMLSYSRNLGAQFATGDFLFFIDDDNVVDKNKIKLLVDDLERHPDAGVAMPIMHYYEYPESVWTYHIERSALPGFYWLRTDPPRSNRTFSFHNAFILRREVFQKVGVFDSKWFPIHYSELDYTFRMRKFGYDAIVVPDAKIWHHIPLSKVRKDPNRAYYTLRNRLILSKKYSGRSEYAFYLVYVLLPLSIYYIVNYFVYAKKHRLSSVVNLINGIFDAFTFSKTSRKISKKRILEAPVQNLLLPLKPPLVSVVIPTKNSALTLKRCLRSLENQTYRNFETIVVDNYSSDYTREIALEFDVTNVILGGPERSSQVNLGINAAKGEYIYRVDSDFTLDPYVLEDAVKHAVNLGWDAVVIHNTSDPSVSIWSKVRKLERDCYVNDSLNVATRFFSRNALDAIGLFDKDMIASEDYDLHNRIVSKGLRIGRINPTEMHIGEPHNLEEIVAKHFKYGKNIDLFIKKYRWFSIKQLSPIRHAYIRHWKDFIRQPHLAAGFLIYQYVRYASALIGYLASKLR